MFGVLRTLDGQEHMIGEEVPPIECLRCGICCQRYQPRVTDKEIEAMTTKLGMAKCEFISRYVQQAPVGEGFVLRRSGNGCVFLSFDERSKKAKCTIYPVRPNACRNWTASLSRLECQEGLARLKLQGTIVTPKDMYPSQKSINKLCIAALGESR